MTRLTSAGVLVGLLVLVLPLSRLSGQAPARPQQVIASRAATPVTPGMTLDMWNASVTQMAAAGRLALSRRQEDRLRPGRTHERFAEVYGGVPVFGGGITRQLHETGRVESIFGTVHPDIGIAIAPTVDGTRAASELAIAGGGPLVIEDGVRLMILPTTGGYRLTWTARTTSLTDGRIRRVFIDAGTARPVFAYDDTWTQVLVIPNGETGVGTGVIGDRLKLGVEKVVDGYRAVDRRWPGNMTTFDMRGDPNRTRMVQIGSAALAPADVAQDADNVWTDGPVSSAHAYGRLSLLYMREVHRLSGLDGQNRQPGLFVNPANPEDFARLRTQFPLYFNNAFYTGGRAFFGVGNGGSTRNFAAGIDVVAHELAHGVTAFSSNLIYMNESGALNEAFSDIVGAATEFAYQPAGTGLGMGDWVMGEDILMNGAIRSMSNPTAFGDPDHYSQRFMGTADNGGVHINSGIINHMFYLAVMGGSHRLSGLAVDGVGFDNRADIERVIVRAFTDLLPPGATFSMARAATIQAARDLPRGDSRAEAALVQAWNAVGVQ